MKSQVIARAHFRKQSWKNGKGTTEEMFIQPAYADFSKLDFEWRLSSARVEADCDFSVFRGFNRLLTIIEGPALKLSHRLTDGGEVTHLLRQGECHEFSGDFETHCELDGAPVVDVGLMVRADRYLSSAQWGFVLPHQNISLTALPQKHVWILIYLLEGELQSEAGTVLAGSLWMQEWMPSDQEIRSTSLRCGKTSARCLQMTISEV
jgi:environmental stress-induced protein Ves